MSVRVGCPFCNHKVVLPAVPASGRAVCDRCGEAFPVTGAIEEIGDAPPEAVAPARSSRPLRYQVLGAVIGVASLGTVLALQQFFPAPRAVEPPAPPPAAGPVTWPPPAVPLLGHLPADTGLAVAVQPGPLLAHAKRTDTDPQKLLAGVGVPDRFFATLTQLGLSLEEIDQLAGGLSFPADNAIPRVVLAVKLKSPASSESVLIRLKAERAAGGRYRAVVGGLPVTLETLPGEVVVFAAADADLDRPFVAGGGHLPAGLRETLGKLSPSAFAWAATDAADWADKPTVKLAVLALKRPDLPDKLKLVRAAGVGLSLEPALRATAALKGAGDPAAFQDRLAAAVAGRDVLVGGGDGWTTLELAPDAVPGLLGK